MTKDASFKKVVRRHAEETGQHIRTLYLTCFVRPREYFSSAAAATRAAFRR